MQDFGSKIKCDLISAKLPSTGKILKLEPKNQDFGLLEWLKENKKPLEDNLIKFGGILFRNFNLESLSEFNKAVQIICPNLIDYTYRSTPRTKLGGKIYTATEYPKERSIAFHNENSYSRSWPNKIFFYSAIVAEDGGETPIADSRNVYEAIDSAIKQKFEKKGVLYIRNYTPGIDLSWQEVFQTENKEEVNKY